MRKPIIAGNWKMFKTRDEALAFIYAVNESLPSIDDVDTVICAPFVVLRCLVNKKLHAAFKHNLIPILCVGEHLEERENNLTENIIKKQLIKDLEGLTKDEVKELVIAYEPIWAIGTGRTATADVADETCGFIRKVISKLYDEETGATIRIQYGGSVKVNNIEELMSKPNIDGALIGGASLVAEDFIYFANVASKLK